MAKTWESMRLAVIRKSEAQLIEDMRGVARDIASVVNRYAVGPSPSQRTIPDNRLTRARLSRDVYDGAILPYFVGSAGEPIRISPDNPSSARAGSPYAQLIFDGVRRQIEIVADRQIGIIRRYTQDQAPDLWRYLSGARPVVEMGPPSNGWYDPFHLFVYNKNAGAPYQLSDAIWDTAEATRDSIDRLLSYYISDGASAVDLAAVLETYLTVGEKGRTTTKPYGRKGIYSALRLARTEITAAAGRAMINASRVNPYIDGIKWNLSPSHPKTDNCDNNAAGGDGQGVYGPDSVPGYPDHPHCLCYLTPVTTATPAQVTDALRDELNRERQALGLDAGTAARIRADVEAKYASVLKMQGAYNRSWMTDALMFGEWLTKIAGIAIP